jgi:hypothetical protein
MNPLSWSAPNKKVILSCNRAFFCLKPLSRNLSISNISRFWLTLIFLSHITCASVVKYQYKLDDAKFADTVVNNIAPNIVF